MSTLFQVEPKSTISIHQLLLNSNYYEIAMIPNHRQERRMAIPYSYKKQILSSYEKRDPNL